MICEDNIQIYPKDIGISSGFSELQTKVHISAAKNAYAIHIESSIVLKKNCQEVKDQNDGN